MLSLYSGGRGLKRRKGWLVENRRLTSPEMYATECRDGKRTPFDDVLSLEKLSALWEEANVGKWLRPYEG